MGDRELDAELARIESAEERDELARGVVRDAIDAGLLGDTYAGHWLDEEYTLVVAVTQRPEEALDLLKHVAPDLRMRTVEAVHSFATLQALMERVFVLSEELGADLRGVGIEVVENRVSAMLPDLAAPDSKRLMAALAGDPIRWEENWVEPA